MNMVLKKALGFAGALVLTAGMVLAAAPVQASDVDSRIQALERELAQLKQNQEHENQERALAAEMKGPSFKYAAGKGLTIAAADNNWSITFGQRLQLYTSFYLTEGDPDDGYQDGQITVRRFRPSINVTSQQGFYSVKWTFSGNSSAFDGDGYLHFEKMNPWLPTVGFGYNPSFNGNKEQGFGRTEDSFSLTAPSGLGFGSSVDRGLVASWKALPAMGISKITHLDLAVGHDELDEYCRTIVSKTKDWDSCGNAFGDNRSYHFALGIQPLGAAKANSMGGLDVGSVTYSFGYVSAGDKYPESYTVRAHTTQRRVALIKAGTVTGEHDYMIHGLRWSPVKWLTLSANYITYEGESTDRSATIDATEGRIAALLWVWGPKTGLMGGSKGEGGVSISPMYTAASADWDNPTAMNMSADATNYGLAVVYNVPGGWMQVHGVWDNLGCESDVNGCQDISDVAGDGDSFNVFTLILEYRF